MVTEREFATDVVKRLATKGYQALWAGGCVRDQLLGLEPDDYDVATNALPTEVVKLFPRTVTVGISFGVVEVIGPKQSDGTHLNVQVATFRSDGEYHDGRRPSTVQFSDAKEDALRRDFTINGMFFDPLENAVLDFVGGQQDLSNRVLRAIGNPEDRFEEDKLRLLRAIRFTHRFGCSVDPGTIAAMKKMAPHLNVVSTERIAVELRKILAHPSRAAAVAQMIDLGLLQVIIPQLFPLNDRNATLQVLQTIGRGASVSFGLAMAVLLHALQPKNVEKLLRHLKLSNAEIDQITWLVARQDSLRGAATQPNHQLFPILVHPHIVELCEWTRTSGGASDAEYCEELLASHTSDFFQPVPLVTGDDLREWGYKPGKIFKEILDQVRNMQLDGQLSTTSDAKEYILATFGLLSG